MELIAEAKGVGIHAEKDWEYSFFTSPYAAHRDFAAVDIYQGREFGETAYSPVEGIVYKTLKFDSPTPIKKSLPEYLILVRKNNYLARLMHVEPTVREGDRVKVGDELGRFICNGFFYCWVDAGMHVEVRDLQDYMRSRGTYELKPALKGMIHSGDEPVKELKGKVTAASERNITVEPDTRVTVKVGDKHTVLDAVSFFDYGGVLGRYEVGERVYFNGIEIGKINRVGAYMSIFDMEELKVKVNGFEFMGFASMFNSRKLKLLPKEYGKPVFSVGDEVEIEIKNETG